MGKRARSALTGWFVEEMIRDTLVGPQLHVAEQLRDTLVGLQLPMVKMIQNQILDLGIKASGIATIVTQPSCSVLELASRALSPYFPPIASVIEQAATASAVKQLIESINDRSTTIQDSAEPPVDIALWLQQVLHGLLVIGGPLIVLQVVFIAWSVAGHINSDARQQVAELIGLLAFALAMAPAFSVLVKTIQDAGK